MPSTFDPAKEAATTTCATCLPEVPLRQRLVPNLRKHGVSLAEGDGVLNDPLALTIEDSSSQGEQRFVSIGMNVFGKPRVVVYALRGDDARIISVRKAEPKIRAYEKGV